MKTPKIPPPNRQMFADPESWPLEGIGVSLDDFVQSYLRDYNPRRAIQRLGVWQGHERTVCELLLDRDDVQVALSEHSVSLDAHSVPAIRSRMVQGLYQLACGADSESVRLAAISRLLEIVGTQRDADPVPDMSDASDSQLETALEVLGVKLP